MPQELISLRKIKEYNELRWLPKQYRDPIIEVIAEVRVQAFKDSIKDLKGAENLTEMQIKILAMSTDASIHIRRDGKINVNGYFNCSGLGLTSLHGLKLGKVKGDFYCQSNSITNLDGFPTENQKHPCDFYRNQGVSSTTLTAIHEIMIEEGKDYWEALCWFKSKMSTDEWNKLSEGISDKLSDDVINGSSVLGLFLNP